jgi:hypothetical protein
MYTVKKLECMQRLKPDHLKRVLHEVFTDDVYEDINVDMVIKQLKGYGDDK